MRLVHVIWSKIDIFVIIFLRQLIPVFCTIYKFIPDHHALGYRAKINDIQTAEPSSSGGESKLKL